MGGNYLTILQHGGWMGTHSKIGNSNFISTRLGKSSTIFAIFNHLTAISYGTIVLKQDDVSRLYAILTNNLVQINVCFLCLK